MKLLDLLQSLDQSLDKQEKIIICGGMAISLAFGGKRLTQDVDVIAPVPLSSHLLKKVALVAKQKKAPLGWLNDACKGCADYLPLDWRQRLVPLDLGYKKLKLYSLGKVDLLMLKLVAGRAQDMKDIETLTITKKDVQIIKETLPRIGKFDSKNALIIKLRLEEWGYV